MVATTGPVSPGSRPEYQADTISVSRLALSPASLPRTRASMAAARPEDFSACNRFRANSSSSAAAGKPVNAADRRLNAPTLVTSGAGTPMAAGTTPAKAANLRRVRPAGADTGAGSGQPMLPAERRSASRAGLLKYTDRRSGRDSRHAELSGPATRQDDSIRLDDEKASARF